MADIDLRQGQSLPEGTLTKYQDMGDGTHALVTATGAVASPVDVSDRLDRLLGRITNYDVLANGTLGGLNAVLPLTTSGLGTVGIAISGTWVGTILVEGNMGNGVWDVVPMIDGTLGTATLTTTGNGNWLVGIAGYLTVRVRMSLYTSGTATVYLEGTSAAAGVFLSRSIPTGVNPIGSVTVTNVVPGVGATALGKAEDGLHASGDTGVMMLAVRNDTRTQAPVVDAAYGPVTIDDEGSTLVHITSGNVPATWASAAVSGNTNGDNELVALAAGQQIYIVGITLVAQGDVDVVLESGTAGPDLTGAISLSADGTGFVWPIAPRGWWARTDSGESLNMRLNAAVFVTGIVTYYTA